MAHRHSILATTLEAPVVPVIFDSRQPRMAGRSSPRMGHMTTPRVPRIIRAGASALIFCTLLSGCRTPNKDNPAPAPPRTVPTPQATATPTTRPAADDPQVGTPELLAKKSQAYTQDLATLIERRQARQEPSKVEWADPAAKTPLPDRTSPPIPRADARATAAKPVEKTVESTKAVEPPAQQPEPVVAANTALVVASPVPPPKALVEPPLAVVTPAAVPAAARQPSPAQSPAVSLEAMEQKLAQRIKDYPRDVAAHFDYQLFHFLRDEQVPLLGPIAPLPSEDRELLASVLDGITNFRNTLRADNNTLLSRKVRPLVDLSDRLRSQADLAIPTIALCNRVDRFGVYEAIEPARFPAATAREVIVYCEVDNFASQLNDKKVWETKLSEEIVLYTENGMPVMVDKTNTVQDVSRARRHDFFLARKITLPRTLVIGRYLLKVSIVDQQASRVAEATVPLVVMAQ